MNKRINLTLRLFILYGIIFAGLALLIYIPVFDNRIKFALVVLLGGSIVLVISRFIINPILSVVEEAREASIEVVRSDLEIKLLNEKLEIAIGDNMRLNASLRQKNEDMEALLYTISHDLRTPLSGIEGYVDLLAEKSKTISPECVRYATKIKESSDFMNTMIKSLLELSRIERMEEKSVNINIGAIVDVIQGMLDRPLKSKNIKFMVKGELLPACGRKNRVQEVFQNLIQNAVKFSRENTESFIEIGSKALPDGFVEYFVKDNGVGVDFENQGKIFIMFFKVKDTGIEGHGIGLAIVKKIIESHGGKVRIESRKNLGTTFYFTLPAAK